MDTDGGGVTRGFVLGKFMPPHAGHVALIDAACLLVDELTVLVCSLPDDSIPGMQRLAWLREIFPQCKIVWYGEPAPQQPDESADFWPIWRKIVANIHPEPIDYVFAGEAYGDDLAAHIGGVFIPIGGRMIGTDKDGLGGVSGSAIRIDPWRYWQFLPAPVRDHYSVTICLHGVESVGKSMLAERLARRYKTVLVPEYGRSHCETHGIDCGEKDLLLIGEVQQAMIEAARPWCNRLLVADTDALMTAAWAQMMIGYSPDQLMLYRRADLYIVLGADVPFVDDGTRIYGEASVRARFDEVARNVLRSALVNIVEVSGDWNERFETACIAIDKFVASKGLSIS